ncbi:hypothetical protein BT69DRAFT_1240232, partial [Atractiella rhizophila]
MVITLASSGATTRVYTVNGPLTSKSASDWITNPHLKKNRKRRGGQGGTGGEGELRLLQDFDFPTASQKIKSTRDGKYLISVGTYKPRMRVWELAELGLKNERVTDLETIDFVTLSEDWTKQIHLHPFRTVTFHNQSSQVASIRTPHPGRSLAYHFVSCDALLGGDGPEVWRFNLERGTFLQGWTMQEEDVVGVNAVDVNPVHGLVCFGIQKDGKDAGAVEFWDPRAREKAGRLLIESSARSHASTSHSALKVSGITALASKWDGLNLAVGTSSGHTFLYDLRSDRPYQSKDQGYGMPIKKVEWVSRAEGMDMESSNWLATVDEKVLKVWESRAGTNMFSINPSSNITDMHVYPQSGLIFLANDHPSLTSYFVPKLGPAPKWCRFLESMTEEMEDGVQEETIWEDYKFVDAAELESLGLEKLLGTPTLRPYMHGYFLPLSTYSKARAIAQPFEFAEYKKKQAALKLEKEQESRIRGIKKPIKTSEEGSVDVSKVKVNRALAKRLVEGEGGKRKSKTKDAENILKDERFKALFEDEDFEIDEESREFALLNPSTVARSKPDVHMRDVESSADEDEDEDEDIEEGAEPPTPRKAAVDTDLQDFLTSSINPSSSNVRKRPI